MNKRRDWRRIYPGVDEMNKQELIEAMKETRNELRKLIEKCQNAYCDVDTEDKQASAIADAIDDDVIPQLIDAADEITRILNKHGT